MTIGPRKTTNGPSRPIKTKRDYSGAVAVVKSMSGQAEPDTAAEARLQSLLRELDKFEEPEEDAGTDDPDEFSYAGPRRRWSDD